MAATVICSICGKEVSKRQSLSIGDGKRACREHQETHAAVQKLAADEKAAKAREEERQEAQKAAKMQRCEVPLKPRCWVCHNEGLRQDEFYLRWILETTRYELDTGRSVNFFDSGEVRKSLGSLATERCLYFVQWNEKNKKIRVPYRTYEMIQMSEQFFGQGTLLVCGECCHEKGFVTMTDERICKLSSDSLMKAAAEYEVFAKPVIEAMARRELEK
jgi:hypothetical protein